MSKKAYAFFQRIQQLLDADLEYQAMYAQWQAKQSDFLEALEALPREQQDIVVDFFGLSEEMSLQAIDAASRLLAEENNLINENNSY